MAFPLKRLALLVAAAATCTDAYGISSIRASVAGRPPPSFSSSLPLFRDSSVRSRNSLSSDPAIGRLSPSNRSVLRLSSKDGSDNGSGGSSSNETDDKKAPTMTLLEKMDSKGQKLKPMAVEAKGASVTAGDDRQKRILYTMKSCVLFTLFIFYRAYRGLFVLMPAVFRETYAKMETAVSAPFVDEGDLDSQQRDVNPETGKVRFRTRLTVSVLSMVVTLTYVISGAWRIFAKFVTTVLKTASLTNSVEAAADEVLDNEDKIKKMTDKGGRINGD